MVEEYQKEKAEYFGMFTSSFKAMLEQPSEIFSHVLFLH